MDACVGGGTSYQCMDQTPWSVNSTLSFGFASPNIDGDCGKCYQLQFTNTIVSGKTMIVMANNRSADASDNRFDLLIPGGGVNLFDTFKSQLEANGVTNPSLGNQYGGFRSACTSNSNIKECVRSMCDDNFSATGLEHLKAGCYWYVDWFEVADNPDFLFKEVDCPSELINKYKR
jgi:hypothetical protein